MHLLRQYKKDVLLLTFLLLLMVPIYFYQLYTIPHQINTDETVITLTAKNLLKDSDAHLFSLSSYFYFPSFIFLVFGKLAAFLGGITLFNIKIIHASIGIGIILFTYLLFRTHLSPFLSFGGAFLLGTNHALIAISRMAMRDNTALFVEVIAFTFLLFGLKRKSFFWSFIGGIIAGLGWYVYYPGRIVIVLWGILLLCLIVVRKISLTKGIFLGIATLLGGMLMLIPLAIATLPHFDEVNTFQREQSILFSEGRAWQQIWVFANSIQEGVIINIKNGLTTFNNTISDQSNIYPNYGHGFLDPATGVLLWIGIFITIFIHKKTPERIIILGGFIFLWLFFAFVTNKAPNYTRLLVTLPFVAYFTIIAIQEIAKSVADIFFSNKSRMISVTLSIIALFGIGAWNIFIFSDFVEEGRKTGHNLGGAIRYVEARAHIPRYTFYIAANYTYPFYYWSDPNRWKTWVGTFAKETQDVVVITPEEILSISTIPPFTIFAPEQFWLRHETEIRARFPTLVVHSSRPYQKFIPIEVVQ